MIHHTRTGSGLPTSATKQREKKSITFTTSTIARKTKAMRIYQNGGKMLSCLNTTAYRALVTFTKYMFVRNVWKCMRTNWLCVHKTGSLPSVADRQRPDDASLCSQGRSYRTGSHQRVDISRINVRQTKQMGELTSQREQIERKRAAWRRAKPQQTCKMHKTRLALSTAGTHDNNIYSEGTTGTVTCSYVWTMKQQLGAMWRGHWGRCTNEATFKGAHLALIERSAPWTVTKAVQIWSFHWRRLPLVLENKHFEKRSHINLTKLEQKTKGQQSNVVVNIE